MEYMRHASARIRPDDDPAGTATDPACVLPMLRDCGARFCFVRPAESQASLGGGAMVDSRRLWSTENSRSCGMWVPAKSSGIRRLATYVRSSIPQVRQGPPKVVIMRWAQLSTAIGRIPRGWLSD